MKKAAAVLAIVLFSALGLAACDNKGNTPPVYNPNTVN